MLDVRAFGAKGDDIADDQKPINDAIQTASKNGGIVYFPVGLYRTTEPRIINSDSVVLAGDIAGVIYPDPSDPRTHNPYLLKGSGIHYEGIDAAIKIMGPGQSSDVQILSHPREQQDQILHNEIRNLSIDAPKGSCIEAEYATFLTFDGLHTRAVGVTKYYIHLSHCVAATLSQVVLQGCAYGHGVYAINESNSLRIYGCRFSGNLQDGTFGLYIDFCSSCYINNAILEQWDTAVRVGTTENRTSNVKFDNCYFEGNKYRVAYVGAVDGNSDVENVSFVDCYAVPGDGGDSPPSEGAFSFQQVDGLRFEGNSVDGKAGKRLLWYGKKCQNARVWANHLKAEPNLPDLIGKVEDGASGMFQTDVDGRVVFHGNLG
jgi:hypothetical protein